jgi:hypothetical protein
MELNIYQIAYRMKDYIDAQYVASNRDPKEVRDRFIMDLEGGREKPVSVDRIKLVGIVNMPLKYIPLTECCFVRIGFCTYVRRRK